MSLREQNLLDSLISRLEDADIFAVQTMTKDVENSEAYKDPTHADHTAHLKMVPLLLGAEMKLNGEDPQATHTMEDNQRFTHDIFPKEPEPLDTTEDEARHQAERNRAVNYLADLQNGKITGIGGVDMATHVKAAQKNIIQIDADYAEATQTCDLELERIETLEAGWSEEQAARSAQMKKDFMATRLRGILKGDVKQVTELAENEWQRLANEYGV